MDSGKASGLAARGEGLIEGRASRAGASVGRVLSHVNGPALVATILWAGNKTAQKLALVEMDPVMVGVLRLSLAGLVLLAVLAVKERSIGLPRSAWPRMLALGTLGLGLNSILFLTGLKLSSVSNSALISTTSPVFCMAMAVAFGQERLVRRRLAGVLLALLGVALLIRADAAVELGRDFLGDILLLGAAVTWAAYSVLGGKLLRAYGSVKSTAYSLLIGAATLGIVSPLTVENWDLGRVSLTAWAGLLYAAILASVVGLTLWNVGIRRTGATQTMVYTYLAPVLAIGSAALVLGERMSVPQVVGGGVVLIGLALSAGSRKP